MARLGAQAAKLATSSPGIQNYLSTWAEVPRLDTQAARLAKSNAGIQGHLGTWAEVPRLRYPGCQAGDEQFCNTNLSKYLG